MKPNTGLRGLRAVSMTAGIEYQEGLENKRDQKTAGGSLQAGYYVCMKLLRFSSYPG